ncbi:MAG: DUF2179 domain-containing protein [Phycisphaerae bacterium]|nr:DUF2179 domain-containing protein [Phycisphaerae bacterium]
MGIAGLIDSPIYAWGVLPFLIFLSRVVDVSMGTVRVIFVSRGMKYMAPLVGFVEVLVWLLAVGQVMRNLTNPICYLAYAGGFAMGNYIGICIADRLSLGLVMIRVITKRDASSLIACFRNADFGVTSVDGEGKTGQVKIVFTIVPRKELSRAVGMIKQFNPQAFYSIEEVNSVQSGVFPLRSGADSRMLTRLFRPMRKGK